MAQLKLGGSADAGSAKTDAKTKVVLVTRLREGQRATVLQMPASARTAEIAAEARKLGAVVI